MTLKVMLVALEPSADNLGAGLMRALREQAPEGVDFVGIGGAAMTAEGLRSAFSAQGMAIFGLDRIGALLNVFRRVEDATRLAIAEQPDALVLIDSWGFTVQVAQRVKQRAPEIPIIKYVAPQVWASRPWRTRTLAKAADHLLAIHSFEPPLFEAAGLATTFVGNPVLSFDFARADGARLREQLGIAADAPILLILPGSRPNEIKQHMGPFEGAVEVLKATRPDLQLVLPAGEAVSELVKARTTAWKHHVHVVEGEQARRDAMKAATVAMAKSGTVTTELALAGCPMVVAYRVGAITGFIILRVLTTRYISLVNIAAQAFVAPEFIQSAVTAQNLAREVGARLDDPELRARQIAAQNAALDRMGRGGPDPSARAAEAVLKVIRERQALR